MPLYTFLIASLSLTPSKWSYRGYLESRAGFANAGQTKWFTVQRARPTFKYKPNSQIGIQLTLNSELHHGKYAPGELHRQLKAKYESTAVPGLNGELTAFDDVIEECEWELSPTREIEGVFDVLTIPRLFLDIRTDFFDLRAGRQAINWGSAAYFNPTDVFAQNLFAEPWQERKGINAIRLNADVVGEGWLTALAAIDDDLKNASGGIKFGINRFQTDFSGIAAYTGNQMVAGIDLKGESNIGWWIEAAHKASINDQSPRSTTAVSAGIDYTLDVAEGLYLMGQLSYDGSGEIPQLYDWTSRRDPNILITDCPKYNITLPDASEEQRQTLGKWYALSRAGLSFQDKWRIELIGLMNLADRTGLLFPTVQYRGDDLSLTVGLNTAFGSNGEFRPPESASQAAGIELNDLYPTLQAIAWLRWHL